MLRGEEDGSMLHTHMKPTKYCLKAGGEKRNENTMEGVNLLKVHCMHVWNYGKEIPSYY
jgi:hypothetical protein